ncbi:hypothetical protein OPQ81_004337 [Rhizoctonia solani]|nr:hypothetical protein OPQ81_004337 [Rhizoctonia solani]
MDHYFPAESPEAIAHAYIKDHLWHDPTITIDTIGRCAAYAALLRYVVGEDLYVPPRNASELDYILKRYTTGVLHSLVSQARDSELRTGLPKARQIAAASLNSILQNSELLESLLARHSPPENDVVALPTSAQIDSSIPPSRRIPTV